MVSKLTKAVIPIVISFLAGIIITYAGFFKGRDIAIAASSPEGAAGWIASQEMVLNCTYFLVIIGVSLIILSIMLSAVLFMCWLKKSN